MLTGVNTEQRVEFTSNYDKTEPKTIFILRPLSGFEMLELSNDGNLNIRNYVESSVVEIRGVDDKTKFLNSLSTNILGEIIKKLNELNTLTSNETKN